jgi:hypothetical protein
MARVLAYCAGCDSEIEVEVSDAEPERLTREQLNCPHEELCRPRDCVLARVPEDQWSRYLEFLPGEAGSDRVSGLEESSRMVEMGRRLSLAREVRRWILWWR